VKRTTISLAVVVAVLAVVIGLATVTRPSEGKAAPPQAASRVPVQQTEAICPNVKQLPGSSTTVSAVSPPAAGTATGGEATMVELADRTKVRGKLESPGRTGVFTADNTELPALVAGASGAFAPGFSVGGLTRVPSGAGRGLAGVTCEAPATERWFVGTSTAQGRESYLYLANSKDTPALVDVEIYGPNGLVEGEAGRGLTLAPGQSQGILLSTLTPAAALPGVAVHVVARTGRVSAALRDQEGTVGTDWLPSSAAPARNVVIPGVPGEATNVQLVLLAPGGDSTDVAISIAGKVSTFKPVDNGSVEVKGGKVTVVDLGPIGRGDASAIRLAAGRADIVAGVRVVQGTGADAEAAFLAGAPVLTERAVVADNRAGGAFTSTVSLTAPQGTTKVKLTSIGDKGEPVSADVEVLGGTTVAAPVPVPPGASAFAVIVEPQPGSPPVHAARTITEPVGKSPTFTVQMLAPTAETAVVPNAHANMTLLVPQK
jgi:uncharacterized protein DUF5719